MLESTISRSACHEENKIRDKQIDHIRNSDVGFNLLYLDCINEPRYQNLQHRGRRVVACYWSEKSRRRRWTPANDDRIEEQGVGEGGHLAVV